MAQKTALIIYAHQSPASFNAAARDVAVQALTKQGYKVLVSDLYAMKFKASATAEDIKGDLNNPEHFIYNDEVMVAWQDGRLSDDIAEEQHKVEQAELVIFQFPLYWFSIPAIMKGWIDRVLSQGFAFTMQKLYDNGVFKNKKAMLSFTTGAIESTCKPDGLHGDINIALWPLQSGVLRFCGFQVLAPQIFWCPAHSPPEARNAMLEGWRERLNGIFAEKSLSYAPTEYFDLTFQGGFSLRSEMKEKYASESHGITTAQHLGKPLPPDNQTKAK